MKGTHVKDGVTWVDFVVNSTKDGTPTSDDTSVPVVQEGGVYKVCVSIEPGPVTDVPSGFPTSLPSGFPTSFPSGFPTSLPSGFPTVLPTG
ncbi:MAG: hypothetical protein HYR62_00155 [Actinobacteria bacterium]|nr:hypothetical protein [Actinomycetota bacterium]MBI3687774.1 hypothetical protein [Actinomycetota bacterium]